MVIVISLEETLASTIKSNRHGLARGQHLASKVWSEGFVLFTSASHTILVIIVMLLLKW